MIVHKCGVYAVRNLTKRRAYVGASARLPQRLSAHRSALRRGTHLVSDMQADWNAGDEFLIEVLLVCAPEHLSIYEQIVCDATDSPYNRRQLVGSNAGLKPTLATKAKIARALSEAFKGVPHSEAHVAAMTKVRRAKAKLTPAGVAAIRTDSRTQRAIAAAYGLSQSTVCAIRLGYIWKELAE